MWLFKRRKSQKLKKSQDNPKYNGTDDDENLPIPAKSRSKRRQKEEEAKKTKPKAGKEDAKVEPVEASLEIEEVEEDLVLKHRKKKGKKPKFQKVQRPKPERDIGTVKRDKNTYYPGDVDFRYASVRENWVSYFGQEPDLDFGDSVRILPDETEQLI